MREMNGSDAQSASNPTTTNNSPSSSSLSANSNQKRTLSSTSGSDAKRRRTKPGRKLPPIRYTIIGLISLGAFTVNMSRITLSSVIISMAPQHIGLNRSNSNNNSSSLDHQNRSRIDIKPFESVCPTPLTSSASSSKQSTQSLPSILDHNPIHHTTTLLSDSKEFDWSENRQSALLGGYHIGYVIALIPSGRISEHYGPKILVTIGGFFNVFLNFVSPIAARRSYWAFLGTRILIGAATASLLPACFGLLSYWVPDDEKSKAIALICVGGSFGTIILSLLSGYLCLYGFDGGWPTVFYMTGFTSFIWFALWSLVVSDRPVDHPFIGNVEIDYIESHLAHRKLQQGPRINRPPWRRMLLSKPVLSITFVKMTHSWVYNLITLKLNNYLSVILQMSIEQISIFTSLFHLVLLLSVLLSGFLADMMISRYTHRKSAIRKIFESFATFGSSIFIALLPFAGCNKYLFVALMTGALACFGMSTGGSSTIAMDLTSEFAATLVAIMSTISMFVGFMTPRLVSQMLTLREDEGGDQLQAQWYNVFYLTALIQCSGGMLFALFATTEYQHWEDSDTTDTTNSKNNQEDEEEDNNNTNINNKDEEQQQQQQNVPKQNPKVLEQQLHISKFPTPPSSNKQMRDHKSLNSIIPYGGLKLINKI